MYQVYFLLLVGTLCQFSANAQIGNLPSDHFVITINTELTGPNSSCDQCFTIPTGNGLTYNYEVDWDNNGTFDQSGITGDVTYDFGAPGIYTIRIKGTFPQIFFGNPGATESPKLLSVDQWGTNVWSSMLASFFECVNLTTVDPTSPDLSQAVTLNSMFRACSSLNADLNSWDTGDIQFMDRMFHDATAFNGNVEDWDTGSVTSMSNMFSRTGAFNRDISNWNTEMVTNFNSMFENAIAFDQNLGDWDLSAATDMEFMLFVAGLSTFNYDATLIGWDNAAYTNKNLGDASGLTYCLGEQARTNLLGKGWTITNDSEDCAQLDGFLNCPVATLVPTDNNNCTATFTPNLPTLPAPFTVTSNPQPGGTLSLGPNTIEFRANLGNASVPICTFTIVVADKVCYLDGDGDGFGVPGTVGTPTCEVCPQGTVDNNYDCNDNDAGINPGAMEVCDGEDNNCNTQTDEDLTACN